MEDKGDGSKRTDSLRDIDSKLSKIHIAESKYSSSHMESKIGRDSAKDIGDDVEADEEFRSLIKKPNEGIL